MKTVLVHGSIKRFPFLLTRMLIKKLLSNDIKIPKVKLKKSFY